MFHAASFNPFSIVLFVIAFIALIATGAYKAARKESIVTALVFAAIGTLLLFFP